MREILALAAGACILAAANHAIVQRERLVSSGRVVLLELAPVDPRSLMQGDYMALRFATADAVPQRAPDGAIVVAVDESGRGRYARLADGAPLAADEVLMRYRVRNGRVKFGTNAFFFQEGHAERYANARFGEFRVGPDGTAILTGLRGPNGEPLGS